MIVIALMMIHSLLVLQVTLSDGTQVVVNSPLEVRLHVDWIGGLWLTPCNEVMNILQLIPICLV